MKTYHVSIETIIFYIYVFNQFSQPKQGWNNSCPQNSDKECKREKIPVICRIDKRITVKGGSRRQKMAIDY